MAASFSEPVARFAMDRTGIPFPAQIWDMASSGAHHPTPISFRL
jgi:hypothetical protein